MVASHLNQGGHVVRLLPSDVDACEHLVRGVEGQVGVVQHQEDEGPSVRRGEEGSVLAAQHALEQGGGGSLLEAGHPLLHLVELHTSLKKTVEEDGKGHLGGKMKSVGT
jgi:hypothetical protein